MQDGLRSFRLSFDVVKQFITEGDHHCESYRVVRDALPADVRLVNVRMAWPTGIELVVSSPDYGQMPDGAIPIEIYPWFETIPKADANASSSSSESIPQ